VLVNYYKAIFYIQAPWLKPKSFIYILVLKNIIQPFCAADSYKN